MAESPSIKHLVHIMETCLPGCLVSKPQDRNAFTVEWKGYVHTIDLSYLPSPERGSQANIREIKFLVKKCMQDLRARVKAANRAQAAFQQQQAAVLDARMQQTQQEMLLQQAMYGGARGGGKPRMMDHNADAIRHASNATASSGEPTTVQQWSAYAQHP